MAEKKMDFEEAYKNAIDAYGGKKWNEAFGNAMKAFKAIPEENRTAKDYFLCAELFDLMRRYENDKMKAKSHTKEIDKQAETSKKNAELRIIRRCESAIELYKQNRENEPEELLENIYKLWAEYYVDENKIDDLKTLKVEIAENIPDKIALLAETINNYIMKNYRLLFDEKTSKEDLEKIASIIEFALQEYEESKPKEIQDASEENSVKVEHVEYVISKFKALQSYIQDRINNSNKLDGKRVKFLASLKTREGVIPQDMVRDMLDGKLPLVTENGRGER